MSDRLLDVEGALVDQHAVPVQFHGPLTARNGGVHLVDHVKGGVAEKIAALTGADLAEIVPAQPYTSENLNYSDRSTRATVEQNTADARPEIANDISLDGYTTVYLGYPIWWGQAPRILSTFVESHDFTGITVIPFCTSGGSGAGRTGETLGEQAGTGTFLSSTRLSAGESDADLQSWIDSRT